MFQSNSSELKRKIDLKTFAMYGKYSFLKTHLQPSPQKLLVTLYYQEFKLFEEWPSLHWKKKSKCEIKCK